MVSVLFGFLNLSLKLFELHLLFGCESLNLFPLAAGWSHSGDMLCYTPVFKKNGVSLIVSGSGSCPEDCSLSEELDRPQSLLYLCRQDTFSVEDLKGELLSLSFHLVSCLAIEVATLGYT